MIKTTLALKTHIVSELAILESRATLNKWTMHNELSKTYEKEKINEAYDYVIEQFLSELPAELEKLKSKHNRALNSLLTIPKREEYIQSRIIELERLIEEYYNRDWYQFTDICIEVFDLESIQAFTTKYLEEHAQLNEHSHPFPVENIELRGLSNLINAELEIKILKLKYTNLQGALGVPKGEDAKMTKSDDKDEYYKHPNIFRNNAFEVWESLYNSFKIIDSSRTDVKFIFEEMKRDGLIYENVDQASFLEWISNTYGIVVEKTSNHSRTPMRLGMYATAKELYYS